MTNRVNTAVDNFKKGHNCAQAVVCAYSDDCNMDQDSAFRLSEGFGGGIPGVKGVCGAASGMVMVASLKHCPVKDVENTTKKVTYPCVMSMMNTFKERMGEVNCEVLLQQKDATLVDGKKAGCIACVECASSIIEETFYGNE